MQAVLQIFPDRVYLPNGIFFTEMVREKEKRQAGGKFGGNRRLCYEQETKGQLTTQMVEISKYSDSEKATNLN